MINVAAEVIEVVEAHGTFLLIRAGSRFAVVERRAGRIYPMMPGKREGEPVSVGTIANIMAEEGCLSENKARQLFEELCDRGDRLARSLR
jgi:hypothetical protein